MIKTRRVRTAKAAVSEVGDQLAKAEHLLKKATAETGATAGDLWSQVEGQLTSALSTLQELRDDAVDGATVAAKATDEYIRDNPWQAIGVAAAAGFLTGVIVSRR